VNRLNAEIERTMIPVSVVVLTFNEERNIADCLASLQSFEDKHILDSGSTDATIARARELGAAIHFNPFTSFGQQRNWAIDHIATDHSWVLHLDADERMTPALEAEIRALVGADRNEGGFRVPSKLMFAGRWLKHAGDYPNYQVRLFHKDRLRFIDYGHGQREKTDHPLGTVREGYLHYAFSQGLDGWFAKHAIYARQEAAQAFAEMNSSASSGGLFSPDRTLRRRALKRLAYRLPGRYFFRLLYMHLIKWAFLDGSAGITYAKMLATYESMMEVHLRLLRRGVQP
jgi:glycosyltransferase involved in cell wall biosynthesis